MKDETLAFLYNTTMEIGEETFEGFPNLSIVARKAINHFYLDTVREAQVFRELGQSSRKGYLDTICKFMVYLLAISHQEHQGNEEPRLPMSASSPTASAGQPAQRSCIDDLTCHQGKTPSPRKQKTGESSLPESQPEPGESL